MGRSDVITLSVDTPFLTDPNGRAVIRALGTDAYFVGGCVRNALLGETATDLDIATPVLPQVVMQRVEAAGLKAVPTGIDHGTITVVSGGVPFEVTTFRKDVETDGRRAVVAFSTDLADDAMRRDFTINALYADAGGTVYDPVGGLPDIAARRVRFIGDPAERIAEDRLRMLRFFRFTAFYADPGQGIDADALSAIARAAQDASHLSAERVGAELVKLLSAADPAPALAAMQQCGLGAVALPGSDATPLARLVHAESVLGLAPDPLRRLAGYAPDIGGLRLSRAQQRRHEDLRALIGSGQGMAELSYRHDAQTARDVAALRCAMLEQHLLPSLEHDIAQGVAAQFPLKARDLRLEGKALGDALRAAKAAWIASGFALTKAELIDQAH